MSSEALPVVKIVDVRKIGRRTEFKIRWEGHPPSEDTWEPREHLVTPDLVAMAEEYEQQHAPPRKKRKKRRREEIPDESFHIVAVHVGFCTCPDEGKCTNGCIEEYEYDGRRYFTEYPAPEAATAVRKWVAEPKNTGFRSRFGLSTEETITIRLEKRKRNKLGDVVHKENGGMFRFRYSCNGTQ